MRIHTFIALRFLRSSRLSRTATVITWISLAGVTLGVTALVITISVLNGFRANLFLSVTGIQPHIRLTPAEGLLPMDQARKTMARLDKLDDVEATGAYFSRQAFLAFGKEYRAIVIRAIEPDKEGKITEITKFISKNTDLPTSQAVLDELAFPPPAGKRPGILIGSVLADSLGVIPGEKVRVVSTVTRPSPLGPVPLMKTFRLVGTFETGMGGSDEVMVYMDRKIASRIFKMKDSTGGIALRISYPYNIDLDAIKQAAPEMKVTPWTEDNKKIFQVMRLEKVGVFVVLTLIIVVSFFNIIGSLIMLVLEKMKGIAILKSMGADNNLVRKIFFMQGVWVGAVGTFGGVALGLLGCWALANFNIFSLPPGVFPGSQNLPVLVEIMDLLIITSASFLICMLATIYPASKAAQVHPVHTLRYG